MKINNNFTETFVSGIIINHTGDKEKIMMECFNHMQPLIEEIRSSLEKIKKLNDPQIQWILISKCIIPKINYFLTLYGLRKV